MVSNTTDLQDTATQNFRETKSYFRNSIANLSRSYLNQHRWSPNTKLLTRTFRTTPMSQLLSWMKMSGEGTCLSRLPSWQLRVPEMLPSFAARENAKQKQSDHVGPPRSGRQGLFFVVKPSFKASPKLQKDSETGRLGDRDPMKSPYATCQKCSVVA